MEALKPYAWLDPSGTYRIAHFKINLKKGTTIYQIAPGLYGYDSIDPSVFYFNYNLSAGGTASVSPVIRADNTAATGAKRISIRIYDGTMLVGSVTLNTKSGYYERDPVTGGIGPLCWIKAVPTAGTAVYAITDSGTLSFDSIAPGTIAHKLTANYLYDPALPGGADPRYTSISDPSTFDIVEVQLLDNTTRKPRGKGTTSQSDADSSGAN